VRYGLFGLGGLLELAMGVLLVLANLGKPILMAIGVVLAVVGIVILVLRIRGSRREQTPPV